ncbi:hypothetical protein [Rhizobium sp. AAP43]|uniref:DUF7007 domain-containing protein n=1 Tax=Rhizobium sp. AAP43 TaxID=1523420 RepID=UPI0006B8C3B8|nr:hypothetical protein [Rhizobium sp. AAP43]KPF42620.1 hypothetical protein IP76_16525 [Rhizobium sp. AAP43]
MSASPDANVSASAPDLSGVEFARSADGLAVARINDLVIAMVPGPDGFFHLASGFTRSRPLETLTRADFLGHDGRIGDEAAFRARVLETADHSRELAELKRVQARMSASTPWGGSQMAIQYGEGVVAHTTASHGGFHLSPDRNARTHPALRKEVRWYEEDVEWAAVAISFPALFTRFERQIADKVVRNTWPEAWEEIHGRALTEGESRAKDRAAFDMAHAADLVVTSAIRSDVHLGMTEVVATIGGDRSCECEERRFLVPCDEYALRGQFGFVIDPTRHWPYDGPSSFLGWREPEGRT